jgi:molybdate transport system substrate-binding protein
MLLSLLWQTAALVGAAPGPMVAAATSLREVLPALVHAFEEAQGSGARLSFGASGNLYRQITQGAPFELFLSADETFVLDLSREGRTQDEGAVYAEGRLAVLVPKSSRLRPDGTLKDLDKALEDGRLRRLAIANPDHAPYGRAAREALERLELWERIQDRLVIGENVSQAAQFAATGAADAGLVAYSLALSPRLGRCCGLAPLPTELHQPLRQRGALVAGAGVTARRLFAFILGPTGRAILQRYGFGVPIRD